MKFPAIGFALSLGLLNAGLSLLPRLTQMASAVPAAPPATAQETQVVSQLLKNNKKFNICVDSLKLETAQKMSRAYKVDSQTYFVVVQCFLAAYQGNYEFFRYSPSAKSNAVKPLPITEFVSQESGKVEKVASPSIGGLPSYDPKERILTIRTKYRGLGDCGSVARYRLDDTALKLLDFKAKFECDGKLTPFKQIFPEK